MVNEEKKADDKNRQEKDKWKQTNKKWLSNRNPEKIHCTNDLQETMDTKPPSSNNLFEELFWKFIGGWKSNLRRQNRPEAKRSSHHLSRHCIFCKQE